MLRYLLSFSLLLGMVMPGMKVLAAVEGSSVNSTTSSLDQSKFVFSMRVSTQWETGYNFEASLTNNSSETVKNWQVEFDYPYVVNQAWNGVLVTGGNHVVVKAPAWKSDIAPGETVDFGGGGTFTAKQDDPLPTNVKINGEDASVDPNPDPDPTPQPGGSVTIPAVDKDGTAMQLDLQLNKDTEFEFGDADKQYTVETNNPKILNVSVADGKMVLRGLKPGRAALRINNGARFIGVKVLTAEGNVPGLPDDYISIGSVSEDSPADLGFWEKWGEGSKAKRVDVRYVYLNGGAGKNNWRTWGNKDGDRCSRFIQNSLRLGMVPFFVWYNIPDGGESYTTDLAHIQNPEYMLNYFKDLVFMLKMCKQYAGNEMVGFVLEPDFIGYMAQNSGKTPEQIDAQTEMAYASGALAKGTDPEFPDNLNGLVRAISYTFKKYLPNSYIGWQFNLWADPAANVFTMIVDRGKTEEFAGKITDYYLAAGVNENTDFVSIDKYGYDAGGAGNGWFFNAVMWMNYLRFCEIMHNKTGKDVVLWQLPVGHINGSTAVSPYTEQRFADHKNVVKDYEDSAPVFFLGDTFTAQGSKMDAAHFMQSDSDTHVTVSGSNITWGSHMDKAKAAGIKTILFGAGVGASTDGVGSPPTDHYWWITKVQDYYKSIGK
ncbi:cellulose binding domain-containing protein [Lentisphaerota bacterium ZTH]|nr:cellulose binding domain-containing protein [Lentisphaerota bacterium]WET06173.1 cellulose binding domain-containing protein [Lentisphaerota bacterium ZTH]